MGSLFWFHWRLGILCAFSEKCTFFPVTFFTTVSYCICGYLFDYQLTQLLQTLSNLRVEAISDFAHHCIPSTSQCPPISRHLINIGQMDIFTLFERIASHRLVPFSCLAAIEKRKVFFSGKGSFFPVLWITTSSSSSVSSPKFLNLYLDPFSLSLQNECMLRFLPI